MPEGLVQAVGKSRSGKPTVTIDGQIYSASQLQGFPQVGDKISFDSASSVYNGATVWFINAWALMEPARKYPSTQNAQQGIPATYPQNTPMNVPSQPDSRGITDAERPFISNCVAHAISAGAIKEPEQIEKWVSAAKNALRSQSE